VLFFVATALCVALPASPPNRTSEPQEGTGALGSVMEAERAVESTFAQLREGISFIRGHRAISWSLLYLVISSSLLGVLGVLGPDFAETTLGLTPKDLAVVVLPMGFGIVLGILLLNAYGRYVPRRRVIEGGLISLGILLLVLSVAGQISQFLAQAEAASDLVDLSAVTSLLAVVIVIAFFAGIAYGFVAIPAQTQLQEDIPGDVRGRVFGVLNMLVSVSSFLPIILVGPISDFIGTTAVIVSVAIAIVIAGIASVVLRGPLRPAEARTLGDSHAVDPLAAALGADRPAWAELEVGAEGARRRSRESPSGFGGDEPDRD
jgi:MFS family permease